MITQTQIQAMSEHLTDAMTKEDLGRRDAAKFLNLNPCYITMAMNPKFWDSMSRFAKDRIKEWHDSRDLISAFQIPEGEEIWKPAEKVSQKTAVDVKETEPVREQNAPEAPRTRRVKKVRKIKAPISKKDVEKEVFYESTPLKCEPKIEYTERARLKGHSISKSTWLSTGKRLR